MNVERGLWVFVGITLLFATASVAQQVKAGFDQSADAQTDLVHATTVIDNERVRVWDIALAQGQSTDFGRHEYDFVTMFLLGGQFRTTSENGATVTERRCGEAVYSHKGAKQEEELIAGGPARLIVVELKDHPGPRYPNTSGYPLAFPRPGSRKVLDNERVVVWNYSWGPNTPTPMHFHDKDIVVVYRYDGSLKSTTPDGKSVVNDYKSGSIWFNRGDRVHFETLVKGRQSAIMVELK
jgi:quercetin dioxygenase-like cupin family protein